MAKPWNLPPLNNDVPGPEYIPGWRPWEGPPPQPRTAPTTTPGQPQAPQALDATDNATGAATGADDAKP